MNAEQCEHGTTRLLCPQKPCVSKAPFLKIDMKIATSDQSRVSEIHLNRIVSESLALDIT